MQKVNATLFCVSPTKHLSFFLYKRQIRSFRLVASPCGRPPGPSINVQSCHIHTLSMIIQAFFHICNRRNKHYFFQCDSFSLEKVISQIQKYFYIFLRGSSGNALWYSNTSLLFSTNIVNHKRRAGTEQGLGQLSLSQLGNLANLVSAGNHDKLSLERFFSIPNEQNLRWWWWSSRWWWWSWRQ